MKFSDLSADVIDDLLTFIPDFSTLSAALLTSKQQVYTVFQSRPKSIVRAVAANVAGGALPSALQLARFVLDSKLAAFDETHVLATPITRDEARVLEENSEAVRTIENFFSFRYKDQASPISRLEPIESSRFRRALYRLWLYIMLKDDLEIVTEEDDFIDHDDDEPPDNQQSATYLNSFATDELFEMSSLTSFYVEAISWMDRAYSPHRTIFPQASYGRIASFPPMSLANSLEMAGLDSIPAMYTEDFFKDEFEKIIRARKVDEKTWSERHDKAILNRATERQDQCHRCHAVCGVNLWGTSNWSILKGYFSRGEMVNLFPGNLTRNAVEMNAFNVYFEQNPQIDDRMLIEQLMALDVDESGVWAKDEWYCLECVKELFRLRYWKWWLEKKRQDGVAIEEDCWYGYNCRTQRHAQPHAQRLNHLCMPTRGTGPN